MAARKPSNYVRLEGRVFDKAVQAEEAKEGVQFKLIVPRDKSNYSDYLQVRCYGQIGQLALTNLDKNMLVVVEGECRSWQECGYVYAKKLSIES